MILQGHVINKLREIPSESIQTCVTSPPYWGLRVYGVPPQIWPDSLPLCEGHNFGESPTAGDIRDRTPNGALVTNNRKFGKKNGRPYADVCLKCGAWRGDLGLEPTPDLYIKHIVQVFEEVRRVLKKDGTLWLNLGDSYAGGGRAGKDGIQKWGGLEKSDERRYGPPTKIPTGLKPKDLVGMPWRVAFALQEAGWYLRSEITWCKIAPMPESVQDRPTSATEKIFLFSKSNRYFYDKMGFTEPLDDGLTRIMQNLDGQQDLGLRSKEVLSPETVGKTSEYESKYRGANHGQAPSAFTRSHSIENERKSSRLEAQRLFPNNKKAQQDFINYIHDHGRTLETKYVGSSEIGGGGSGFLGQKGYYDANGKLLVNPLGRNLWNYWLLSPDPTPDAHFATFPRELPRRCIALGTSEHGECSNCGKAWVRIVKATGGTIGKSWNDHADGLAQGQRASKDAKGKGYTKHDLGWQPQCTCKADVQPQTVLDPFGGSGRTAEVAKRMGRHFITIELNEDYVKKLIQPTIDNIDPLFGQGK